MREKGANFFRFNADDFLNGKVKINFFIDNKLKNWDFNIYDVESDRKIYRDDINIVWFRRFFKDDRKLDNNYDTNIFLNNELKRVYSLFEISLKDCFWINKPSDINNKFIQLQYAREVGLLIPHSSITNNRYYIEDFTDSKKIITKPATEVKRITTKNYNKTLAVHRVILEELNLNFFFPSYIQSEISKQYEIRSFFFLNEVYSIAIFSQENNRTELDFRNYDDDKPNRMSKYTLPLNVTMKIIKLMKKLNMKSGSIDLIKNTNNEYIFLEVNPVGQFGFVSNSGNYYIEKIIAQKLVEIDENEKNNKTKTLGMGI